MNKTLGGDRLGSGSKMQVELHNYERSNFDLSYVWRSTLSAGTLVPFMCEIGLPGDTFDIDLNADIKTHPTIGPLFGTYKVQLDTFMVPIRLYNSLLHNNMLGIGMDMSRVKLPVLELHAVPTNNATDIDNAQINPSSILSYLGIRGVGQNPTDTKITREFNGVPYLAYWDIYKNYYANKSEEIGAVIHTPTANPITSVGSVWLGGTQIPHYPTESAQTLHWQDTIQVFYTGGNPPDWAQILVRTALGWQTLNTVLEYPQDNGTDTQEGQVRQSWDGIEVYSWRYIADTDIIETQPQITTFALSDIDQMRKNLLAYSSESAPFNILDQDLYPYKLIDMSASSKPSVTYSQEGLALKTYQSDMFNNWLKTDWIEGPTGISAITAVSTAGDSFTIDALQLSKKVYDMLNAIAVSGGSYNDWLDAVYRTERYRQAEGPMYMGGLIKELIFQEVVSTAETANAPLATLAGKGAMGHKHKGGSVIIKVDEPCYIIGILSLTPRVDYSQGNKWDTGLKTLDDLHKPALDQIGFQDLITEQMAWWDTIYTGGQWVQNSAGKQPAWMNYMTNVNQTRGNFAIGDAGEMFMTLNRRYEMESDHIKDLTTYIDPSKFNFIFADTSLDSQNFWAQIAIGMQVRRKMSSKIMPNL